MTQQPVCVSLAQDSGAGTRVSSRATMIRVWDAPTRLFHWAIVLLLVTSWVTQHENWMGLHLLSGYSILTLLLFRLTWGFIGSDTARFSQFLRSPFAALRHLAYLHRREPDTEIGHNAAGGWMVLLLLGLLAVQVATGLCANDDGNTQGPLADSVGKDWSDYLSHIHAVNLLNIEIAVAVHVTAVLLYAALKRQNLLRPMITGRKRLPTGIAPPALVSPWRAVALFAVTVAAVTAVLRSL